MSTESKYKNSESDLLVDIVYLAVNDKVLVNKIYTSEDDELENFSYFDTQLWVSFHGEKDSKMTVLLTYSDTEEYEASLQKDLTDLSNEDLSEELVQNVFEMFSDALTIHGFNGTYISDLIDDFILYSETVYIRTIDFSMHSPEDNIHPMYDT
ncbi:MAG: hypothetical protein ACYDD5_00325 [Sulfuricurvum sp.]